MKYWLIKTEPDHDWSWQQQLSKGIECWDGVRNYGARNNLKSMKRGDKAFFYHSGKERRIMGIVSIHREFYADASDPTGKFVCVDIKTDQALKMPVTLSMIKAVPALADMQLVRLSRLSVQVVRKSEWNLVRKLGGVKR